MWMNERINYWKNNLIYLIPFIILNYMCLIRLKDQIRSDLGRILAIYRMVNIKIKNEKN